MNDTSTAIDETYTPKQVREMGTRRRDELILQILDRDGPISIGDLAEQIYGEPVESATSPRQLILNRVYRALEPYLSKQNDPDNWRVNLYQIADDRTPGEVVAAVHGQDQGTREAEAAFGEACQKYASRLVDELEDRGWVDRSTLLEEAFGDMAGKPFSKWQTVRADTDLFESLEHRPHPEDGRKTQWRLKPDADPEIGVDESLVCPECGRDDFASVHGRRVHVGRVHRDSDGCERSDRGEDDATNEPTYTDTETTDTTSTAPDQPYTEPEPDTTAPDVSGGQTPADPTPQVQETGEPDDQEETKDLPSDGLIEQIGITPFDIEEFSELPASEKAGKIKSILYQLDGATIPEIAWVLFRREAEPGSREWSQVLTTLEGRFMSRGLDKNKAGDYTEYRLKAGNEYALRNQPQTLDTLRRGTIGGVYYCFECCQGFDRCKDAKTHERKTHRNDGGERWMMRYKLGKGWGSGERTQLRLRRVEEIVAERGEVDPSDIVGAVNGTFSKSKAKEYLEMLRDEGRAHYSLDGAWTPA